MYLYYVYLGYRSHSNNHITFPYLLFLVCLLSMSLGIIVFFFNYKIQGFKTFGKFWNPIGYVGDAGLVSYVPI